MLSGDSIPKSFETSDNHAWGVASIVSIRGNTNADADIDTDTEIWIRLRLIAPIP